MATPTDSWPWRQRPPPNPPPPVRPREHDFPQYGTVCRRCGLSLLYAGMPDMPPCLSDQDLAVQRALRRR
jgi:hypothetical protein